MGGLRMLTSKHSCILIPYIFMSLTQGCSSQLRDSLQVPGLGQYRWSKRVIVTYSQSEGHPEVVRLKTEISQRTTTTGNWSTSIPTRGMGSKISSLTSLVTMGIQSTRVTRVLCRQFSISSTKCP